MKIIITIDCDHAAFEDHGADVEANWILRAAMTAISMAVNPDPQHRPLPEPVTLRDHNGNRVGQVEFTD